MKRIARSMYRRIYWLTLLGILILSLFAAAAFGVTHKASPHNQGIPVFLIVCTTLFWGWIIFGRRISSWLLPLFVSSLHCPGCGEDIETVAVWNCNCGFHDHKERNVLTKRAPSAVPGRDTWTVPAAGRRSCFGNGRQ